MTSVSQAQARTRFKSLSESLQDALFDPRTMEGVLEILSKNDFPADKTNLATSAVGLVILGYIKVEELGREIQERTGIDPRLAAIIAGTIDEKIISPIKADIRYAPAQEKPDQAKSPTVDLRFPSAPKPSSPTAPAKFEPTPSSEKPFPSSPAPEKSNPPATPAAPAAPIFIHQETKVEPVKESAGFRLDFPAPRPVGQKISPSPVPKANPIAQVEMGNMNPKTTSKPAISEIKPKVVHYTQSGPVPVATPKVAPAPGAPMPLGNLRGVASQPIMPPRVVPSSNPSPINSAPAPSLVTKNLNPTPHAVVQEISRPKPTNPISTNAPANTPKNESGTPLPGNPPKNTPLPPQAKPTSQGGMIDLSSL